MSESATTTTTTPLPTSTTTTSPATPPANSQQSTLPAQKTEGEKTFSHEYVRELREENKGVRLKLSESEQQKTALAKERDEAKAEADKRVKDAQSAADQRVIRAELKAVALKAGMVDLDGLKLADLSKVTMDDKGEVQGADTLMEELKKAKPYLFGGATTTTSSTTTPPPPKKEGDTKKAKDMSEEEFEAGLANLRRAGRAR